MFKVTSKSNFDTEKLLRQAKDLAARQIEQKCNDAAAPFGGVTVNIERSANGTPSKVSFQGSSEAVAAAKRALA